MQVGDENSNERKRADEIYTYVISPCLKRFGIEPYRADRDPSPGRITTKLLSELVNSRVVVADLTGRNPNVFYELGIAHSFGKPLISIAESASVLPFDTKDERVIQLGTWTSPRLHIVQAETARAALMQSLEIVLAEDYEPPSPLREAASVRTLDELAPHDPVVAELGAIKELLSGVAETVELINGGQADIAAFRTFLKGFKFEPQALQRLTTDTTSADHDAWVAAQVAAAAAREAKSAAEDPWATRSSSHVKDPWGGGTEEPPF
jgi:hypothetical protein